MASIVRAVRSGDVKAVDSELRKPVRGKLSNIPSLIVDKTLIFGVLREHLHYDINLKEVFNCVKPYHNACF